MREGVGLVFGGESFFGRANYFRLARRNVDFFSTTGVASSARPPKEVREDVGQGFKGMLLSANACLVNFVLNLTNVVANVDLRPVAKQLCGDLLSYTNTNDSRRDFSTKVLVGDCFPLPQCVAFRAFRSVTLDPSGHDAGGRRRGWARFLRGFVELEVKMLGANGLLFSNFWPPVLVG